MSGSGAGVCECDHDCDGQTVQQARVTGGRHQQMRGGGQIWSNKHENCEVSNIFKISYFLWIQGLKSFQNSVGGFKNSGVIRLSRDTSEES